MGVLGSNVVGRGLIDLMGHMHADNRLEVRVRGVSFPSPMGLGWRVDPECRATRALQRFGVGCVERREGRTRSVQRGQRPSLCDGPLVGRELAKRAGSEGVYLTRREDEEGEEVMVLPSGEAVPVVSWDSPVSECVAETGGVVLQVGSRLAHGGWQVPVAFEKELPERIRSWRKRLGDDGVVIVSGGVGEPSEAVELMEAGASLMLVDAGLVFNGPGLVKRCNAALLGPRLNEEVAEIESPVFRQSWFWALALGIALAGGGVLALGLSFSRVLLPYDEQFLGFTAETMQRNLPKLHAFMAHDRGTLAGVMMGLGWLYAMLAWGGIRMGVDGAKTAVVASALAGFASFFSFLGFGYFDTLHAFVAAVLFQFSVQVMVGRTSEQLGEAAKGPDDEDPKWRRAQWGQFCWVIHAVGLLLAGCVILGIGMTRVFVNEDLAFLCMSVEQVRELGDRVVSVVAHDRATLGGMLWAAGMGMLLPVLWCHQRGANWLWWAVLGLGVPAYGATLGMHWWVGYTDWRHILPAGAGLALWAGGLRLSSGYLRERLG